MCTAKGCRSHTLVGRRFCPEHWKLVSKRLQTEIAERWDRDRYFQTPELRELIMKAVTEIYQAEQKRLCDRKVD